MTQLAPSDLAHFETAQFHFKEERLSEAASELGHISPYALANHPDLLEFRWELSARNGDWNAALHLAQTLCHSFPEKDSSWLYHACSLNELNRIPEAWDVLICAAEKFPHVPGIAYNLACCGCKLGLIPEAGSWLAKTMETGGRIETKLMALNDSDLAPLWPELCRP
jgi:predicted Zn-dependent protease